MFEALIAWLNNHLILTHVVIIIVSLYLMGKSSSYAVEGVSNYAKKLGLSDYITGLFVVAIAASAPEFLASVSGITFAAPEVVFGAIFGSNLLGITLVLGILALVGKKVKVQEKIFEKTKWDILLLIALPFVLLLDGVLGTLDGILLLAAFVGYMLLLWKRQGDAGEMKKVEVKMLYKDGALFLLALIVVLLSSLFMVHSSLQIATLLSLPTFLVSLVIVGIGSQVPDLFLSLQAVKKHREGVALGELIGSMIAKSLLFMGIFAIIAPLTLPVANALFIGVITVFSSWLVFWMVRKKYLLTWHGYVLLGIGLTFFAIQLLFF